MNNSSKNILAIDIGSTKVCAIIAEVKDDLGDVRIIGAGIEKSQGLKRGSITNIDLASRSIKSAFEDAKRVAGTFVTDAIVSISGAYAKSIDSSGIVNVPDGEIGLKEIDRVMQTAKYNANIPADYDILHILPYNFKVDEQDFVEDPLGMNASRLEAYAHIIITPKSNFNNLKRAVESAGLKVKDIVLNSYASLIATANIDEKNLGIGVIDMGGNTSSFVVQAGGNAIRHNGFLGVGSSHITKDLSMALHTPVNVAENVKITYGNLSFPNDDLIELPVIGDENSTHEVSLDIVGQVIQARVAETLELIAKQINDSGLRQDIGAGFILTGGLTKLAGIRELAMKILEAPVRLAKPKHISGLFESLRDPAFATSIGLIMYSTGSYSLYEFDSNDKMKYNEDIVSKNKIRNNISLENIAPTYEQNQFGLDNSNYQPQEIPDNQRNIGININNQHPNSQERVIPSLNKNENNSQNNQLNNGKSGQPIREELRRTSYYDNPQVRDNITPHSTQGQNSFLTKMWQWITQLF